MEAVAEDRVIIQSEAAPFFGLSAALGRLDRLLDRAVVAAQTAYGVDSATDRFRGLHLGLDEIVRLLHREPGAPVLHSNDEGLADEFDPASMPRLTWLAENYGLSQFDLDVLLIALAPELDLRYERLYAYLHDDVTRRRPSIDLALNLLCRSAEEKVVRRAHFAPSAPLLHHGLLRLFPDPHHVQPPLIAHYLKLDEQIVSWLLESDWLDERLQGFSRFVVPLISSADLPLDKETRRLFSSLCEQISRFWRQTTLYLQGPRDAGKQRMAEALALESHSFLLCADLARAANTTPDDFAERLKLLARQACLRDAILFLDDVDALAGDDHAQHFQRLLHAIAEASTPVVIGGNRVWSSFNHQMASPPLGVITIAVPLPDYAQRRLYWSHELAAVGIEFGDGDLDDLANRFRLTSDQIAEATAAARNRLRLDGGAVSSDGLFAFAPERVRTELFASARAQSSQNLASLAWKIEPHYGWRDIVLPDESLAQLREICSRVSESHRVLDEWGFGRKLSYGKGISALFAGPSGTGKTMAAEVIASELGLDLYKIDLSGVISKYIGETEKNLDRIFSTATNANVILFFDEADALFGKRSEVRDSHDRYANIETSYLLQKMEQYEGIAILATNLRQNMDEAFTRRLQFIVEFPFPDESQRKEIWQTLFPAEAPRDEAIDFDFLAKQFRITGGNIKNIVLGAAFLASGENECIGMKYLIKAAQREFQKMGRVLNNSDLGKHGKVQSDCFH